MAKFLNPKVRQYLYDIVIALGPLAVFYDWLSGAEWELIQTVIYAVLLSGTGAIARKNVERAPDYNASE